jgi:hypothetical protein
MVLIPKSPGADRIENFRPIALANIRLESNLHPSVTSLIVTLH